jgi:hypothetical protein
MRYDIKTWKSFSLTFACGATRLISGYFTLRKKTSASPSLFKREAYGREKERKEGIVIAIAYDLSITDGLDKVRFSTSHLVRHLKRSVCYKIFIEVVAQFRRRTAQNAFEKNQQNTPRTPRVVDGLEHREAVFQHKDWRDGEFWACSTVISGKREEMNSELERSSPKQNQEKSQKKLKKDLDYQKVGYKD